MPKTAKKEKVEYSNAQHGAIAEEFIKECSNHKAIIEGSNEAISEIRKRAKEELGLEPKTFNKMLAIYHKDGREKFENESSEVLEQYDAIFSTK